MAAQQRADGILDSYAEGIIRDQARRVARRASLPLYEREDLAQDLRFHLWKQSPKYDPSRGRWTTFARCVVERKATALLASCRSSSRTLQKNVGDDVECFDAAIYRKRLPPNQPELKVDVERCLQRLSPPNRALARLLMEKRVSEIARELGVPRSTLYGRIARVRASLSAANLGR